MNPIALQLGSLRIYWYGLIITSAIVIATLLAMGEAKRQKLDPDHILNLVIVAVPAAFVGARLYYVVFEWERYAGNWLEIVAVWHGGLAIHGGLLGGLLAGIFYVRKQKLSFWQLADIAAPSIILGQAIGRWGNFFNQEAHGGVVSREFISRFPQFIQDGMYIQGQYYHPTFLYESIWNFSVFLFLLWYRRKPVEYRGRVFFAYLALYSLGRFFIEGLRTDSLMLGPFRIAQLVSLTLILLAIIGFQYIRGQEKKV
jgi:phosphatidylglycerol:prolipoprotein diacylglycerol transferase